MRWTCLCGHTNPVEAKVCLACYALRPRGPHGDLLGDEARYRSLASARAWAVMADSASLYARRVLGFIAASILMAFPLFLFQAWQWRAGHMGHLKGIGPPLMGAALLALWNVFWVVVMIRLAADEIGGFAEGLGEAVSRLSASTFAWALLAQALISVATGFASLMFIIPGIYVAVKLSLTLPVIVCEGLRPVAAMRRSSRLVRDRFWSVLGALFIMFLATVVGSIALGGSLWAVSGMWTSARTILHLWTGGSAMLVQALFGPFWAIIPTLFYVGLASRHDAIVPLPPQSGAYATMPPVTGESGQR
ncbi:MAG: glycerophosphoryl diester phosphodiesterase membrane domain-containing protein [bacterium]|nr:glycerophosphoryl diester phosphodiesterase membrane domain-containing protein [bacterium]